MGLLLRYICIPILLWGAYAFSAAFVTALQMPKLPDGSFFWFPVGIGVNIAVLFIIGASTARMAFLHELTHALWAKGMGGKILSFYASERKGGYVRHVGAFRWGQMLVSLSPYFFPLLPVLLLALYWIVKPQFHSIIKFCLGYTLCAFYIDIWRSLKYEQSDFQSYGILLGLSFIILMQVLITGTILCTISGVSVMCFWREGFNRLIQIEL